MPSAQPSCSPDPVTSEACDVPVRRAPSPQIETPPPTTQEWDLMFDAVKARLRDAVQSGDDSASVAHAVLECVEALDALHRLLEQQRRTPGSAGSA